MYTGDGTLAVYNFAFTIQDPNFLLVIEDDGAGNILERVRGSDQTYLQSLTFDPINGGGQVTLLWNLPNNNRLSLILAPDTPTQPSSFKTRTTFKLPMLEAALDFIMSPLQRVAGLAQRSLRMSEIDDPTDFDMELPPGLVGAINVIPTTSDDGSGWAPISEWLTLPNLAATLAAAAAALVSQVAAAASASSAAGSAAATAADVTTCNTDATTATSAATVATTQANNAATSATAAAGSATTAATSATAASTSAIAAAASASTATTEAGLASTYATTASTQATAAATSATASSNSATASAASAAAAAASAGSIAVPVTVGTSSAPTAITAAGGVPFTQTTLTTKNYINGSGGAVTVTKNPQIAAATIEGQRLRLVGGTNAVTFADGNGLALNGACVLGKNDILDLDWDNTASVWTETSRSMPV